MMFAAVLAMCAAVEGGRGGKGRSGFGLNAGDQPATTQPIKEVDEIRLLRAENKVLRARIEVLEKQVLRLENKKVLIPGPKPPLKSPTKAKRNPKVFTYRGRPRTPEWFKWRYNEFAGPYGRRVVIIDGKCYDIGKERLQGIKSVWDKERPVVRSFRRTGRRPRIVQQHSEGVFVAESKELYGKEQTLIYYVKGGSSSSVRHITSLLRYIGPYVYKTAEGTSESVAGYVACRTPTRAQFAEALAGGFQLVHHESKRIKNPVTGVWKTRIVSKPVK